MLASQIEIRKAAIEDIDWINTQYQAIGFKPSAYHNEYIVIVEDGEEKVGIGRLQQIANGIAELGGIFVKEQHRGRGVARNIVQSLLDRAHAYTTIYCLPFSHLEKFYRQFGFTEPHALSEVPQPVLEKHQWCDATYEQQTLLFVIHPASEPH